jgi:predicted transcriptional regulator
MLMQRYNWKSRESVRKNMNDLIDKGVIERVKVYDPDAPARTKTVYRLIQKS